jgi:hypothetical protein
MGIRTLAQMSKRPLMVLHPIVAMVNRPTHLQLTVNPNPAPVIASHVHHQNWKGLYTGQYCRTKISIQPMAEIDVLPVLLVVKVDPHKDGGGGKE